MTEAMMDLVELYVIIDDFCKQFMPRYLSLLKKNRQISRVRKGILSTSEVLLIILMFQQSGFINFKWYYENEVCDGYRSYFSRLPSYNRFIELIPGVLPILLRLLNYQLYLNRHYSNGIEYIDSTKYKSVIISESLAIKYLLVLRNWVNQLWAGSLGLSYTLLVIHQVI